jgi:hypothetical protein
MKSKKPSLTEFQKFHTRVSAAKLEIPLSRKFLRVIHRIGRKRREWEQLVLQEEKLNRERFRRIKRLDRLIKEARSLVKKSNNLEMPGSRKSRFLLTLESGLQNGRLTGSIRRTLVEVTVRCSNCAFRPKDVLWINY